jgi:hypothetical protein
MAGGRRFALCCFVVLLACLRQTDFPLVAQFSRPTGQAGFPSVLSDGFGGQSRHFGYAGIGCPFAFVREAENGLVDGVVMVVCVASALSAATFFGNLIADNQLVAPFPLRKGWRS